MIPATSSADMVRNLDDTIRINPVEIIDPANAAMIRVSEETEPAYCRK